MVCYKVHIDTKNSNMLFDAWILHSFLKERQVTLPVVNSSDACSFFCNNGEIWACLPGSMATMVIDKKGNIIHVPR